MEFFVDGKATSQTVAETQMMGNKLAEILQGVLKGRPGGIQEYWEGDDWTLVEGPTGVNGDSEVGSVEMLDTICSQWGDAVNAEGFGVTARRPSFPADSIVFQRSPFDEEDACEYAVVYSASNRWAWVVIFDFSSPGNFGLLKEVAL